MVYCVCVRGENSKWLGDGECHPASTTRAKAVFGMRDAVITAIEVCFPRRFYYLPLIQAFRP